MKIYFWGAARTVTGSAHYIKVNGKLIMLDCGLYQGRRKRANQINRSFRFPPSEVDCVVLSHAHIDHSGNLPNMVRHGFNGSIYATHPTAHLSEVMLKDSGIRQKYNLIIIAIKKPNDDMVFNPSFETKIESGDTVIAVGEDANLLKLEKVLNPN